MSGISAENLARLTSADRQSLADAVEAVLELAAYVETSDTISRSSRLVALRFRQAVEENIS